MLKVILKLDGKSLEGKQALHLVRLDLVLSYFAILLVVFISLVTSDLSHRETIVLY